MTHLALLIDVSRCSGCYNLLPRLPRRALPATTTRPTAAAQPLAGQFWMQVHEVERGAYPHPKLDTCRYPCQHCAAAPCIDAATGGAVYRRDDGIVVIDPVKAQGQARIVSACPYRVIFWNEELSLPQKCTLCAQRLDAGEKEPRCVESCPTGALTFGDLDDSSSEIARRAAANVSEVLHPELLRPIPSCATSACRGASWPARWCSTTPTRVPRASRSCSKARVSLPRPPPTPSVSSSSKASPATAHTASPAHTPATRSRCVRCAPKRTSTWARFA